MSVYVYECVYTCVYVYNSTLGAHNGIDVTSLCFMTKEWIQFKYDTNALMPY